MRTLMAAVCLVCTLSVPAFAQEKAKKQTADPTKKMVANLIKQLEPATLTAEQKEKIEALFAGKAKEVVAKRTEAGIKQTAINQRAKVGKEIRESGKKGPEAQKAIATKLGLTEEQAKVLSETDQMLNKAKAEIGKLLSAEQLAKLQDPLKSQLSPKAKGKNKKAAT